MRASRGWNGGAALFGFLDPCDSLRDGLVGHSETPRNRPVAHSKLPINFDSVIVKMGTPADVWLQGIRMRYFLPADAATHDFVHELAEEAL